MKSAQKKQRNKKETCGEGKYQSMDVMKIGITKFNSYWWTAKRFPGLHWSSVLIGGNHLQTCYIGGAALIQ